METYLLVELEDPTGYIFYDIVPDEACLAILRESRFLKVLSVEKREVK